MRIFALEASAAQSPQVRQVFKEATEFDGAPEAKLSGLTGHVAPLLKNGRNTSRNQHICGQDSIMMLNKASYVPKYIYRASGLCTEFLTKWKYTLGRHQLPVPHLVPHKPESSQEFRKSQNCGLVSRPLYPPSCSCIASRARTIQGVGR
ncbi:hypothetical protein BDN71DRAFT_1446719 [Pleurotus eryngii]|uniref:Uncharacterized protein n=1 Tax=Pleurotus eryngii TaxID=5323 RepID=A0A9P5ZYI8_PLEER|nr:hypothetical protein BDN71DRAFT_1446719 [Pleurotus eryngii]